MEICFEKYTMKTLKELFIIDRAKKDVEYPTGTIIVQVSASKGQIFYLKKPQKIKTMYATFQLKDNEKYNSEYIFYIMESQMPEITAKYMAGLNFQVDDFNCVEIPVHESKKTQDAIVAMMTYLDDEIEITEKEIALCKKEKEWWLDELLP